MKKILSILFVMLIVIATFLIGNYIVNSDSFNFQMEFTNYFLSFLMGIAVVIAIGLISGVLYTIYKMSMDFFIQ